MIDHLSETALSDGLVYGVITEQEYIVHGPDSFKEGRLVDKSGR